MIRALRLGIVFLLVLAVPAAGVADDQKQQQKKRQKLRAESRVWIIRGLQAEFATARQAMPRGEKGLPLHENGTVDEKELLQRMTDFGPAIRPGEIVQITGIDFKADKIIFELNGGGKKKRKWYEGLEIGMGRSTHPVATNQSMAIPQGSTIELAFEGRVPDITSDELKQMLTPVLDFTRRSASVLYTESLPPEIQEAIKNREAVVGMDRDMVLAARGRPDRKVRTTKGRIELEDWIYGVPPAKILFVTFEGDTVIEVKEFTPGIASDAVRAMEAKTLEVETTVPLPSAPAGDPPPSTPVSPAPAPVPPPPAPR